MPDNVTVGVNVETGQGREQIAGLADSFAQLRGSMAEVQAAAADMDGAVSGSAMVFDGLAGTMIPLSESLKLTAGAMSDLGAQAEATAASQQELADRTETATATHSEFGNVLGGVAGTMGGWVRQASAMLASLVAFSAFNDAASAVRNFADALFTLNKNTEQNVYSWRYTYGQGMTPGAAMANAQAMSQWTQQFSMDIPFTRQDLMTSVSGAAQLGLNLPGLEHYYPVIADLAATHINPMSGQPLDLGTTVQAIRGAILHYPRMLRYEIGIDPAQLVQYGLAYDPRGIGGTITDPTTLLPALEKYSEAQGWTNFQGGTDKGAAYETAHATFWGAWSSWLDRIQNFELAGGSKMFGQLKDDLNGISDWWDKHQEQINAFASLFSDTLGSGVKDVGIAFQGFAQGLQQSGFGTTAGNWIKDLDNFFNDPQHQAAFKNIGEWLGTNLPEAAAKFKDAIDKLNNSWANLVQAFGGQGNTGLFQGIVDVFAWFPAQLARSIAPIADFVHVMIDIKNQNWDQALADLNKLLSDEADAATGGFFNIGGGGAGGGYPKSDAGQGGYGGSGTPTGNPHYPGVPKLADYFVYRQPTTDGAIGAEIGQAVAQAVAGAFSGLGTGGGGSYHYGGNSVSIVLHNAIQSQVLAIVNQALQQMQQYDNVHVAGAGARFGGYGPGYGRYQ